MIVKDLIKYLETIENQNQRIVIFDSVDEAFPPDSPPLLSLDNLEEVHVTNSDFDSETYVAIISNQ